MTDVESKIMGDNLSEEFVMQFLGYSRKSMQTYRSNGSNKIPPFKKVGKRHVYPAREFRAWIEKQKLVRSIA